MPYIVVNRENAVLSRVSSDALLSWIDIGVSRATDYRYAITFDTYSGALKCAGMQGGAATWVLPAVVVWCGNPSHRVGPYRNAFRDVEVE